MGNTTLGTVFANILGECTVKSVDAQNTTKQNHTQKRTGSIIYG